MNTQQLMDIWQKNQWGLYENDTHGVVGFGGPLTTERLVEAYSVGVFPWPQNNELIWFCPNERGVLFFNELKIHKRLQRKYKNSNYTYKLNTSFSQVIQECAKAPRRGQSGTWITSEMLNAYEKLFERGHILCFECWKGDELVGGLYGVVTLSKKKKITYFSGESVFGSQSDVSKFCLIKCIEHLQSEGCQWMDIQMVTKLTEDFGGRYISRPRFLSLIIEN